MHVVLMKNLDESVPNATNLS